jgi:hypothetical protein
VIKLKATGNKKVKANLHCFLQDVYILSSSIILVLVCIWHAIVFTIQANYGTPTANKADTAVLIALGLVYFIEHVIMALWIGIRVCIALILVINYKKLSSLKLVCYGQPSLKNSKYQGILSSP